MEKREEEEEQKEDEEHSSLISPGDSMFMDPTNCDVWGNPERWLDIEVDFIKAEVQILQLKASFLKVLLSCGGKWHIETGKLKASFLKVFLSCWRKWHIGNLEHLVTRILVGFQNADLDLQRLWLDFFFWNPLGFLKRTSLEKSLIMANMYGLLSGIRERLKLLQPDIDDVYTVLSNSSGCDADMIYEATEAGSIQEELERIQNCSRADECFDLRDRFRDSERQLLRLSGSLEIQTCFKNRIEALFSKRLFVMNLSCELDVRSWFNKTRYENKLKMILPKLKLLTRSGSETNLMCPLRNEVDALLLKVSLLRVFPNSKGKWHTEDGSLKALLTRIRSVSQSLDAPLSDMLEKLQFLRPDIQQLYNILSKSSMFISVTSAKGVMRKLDSLQESIEDLLRRNAKLVAPVKEELEAVRKDRRFLTNFLNFTTKRCSKPEELRELLIHVEFRVVKISCLLYLCSDENMMMRYGTVQLSSELQQFSSAQPREIYEALKASKSEQGISTLVDRTDLCFLDSLRGYVLELSDTRLGFMSCNKNQILSLHKEVLNLNLVFATDESSDDQMFTNLLKHINAAIIDIGCVIYWLHNDANNRELKIAVAQLQDIVKTAKEYARKAYDVYLPNSLRPKFSKTNVQDFIGFLLEISKFKEIDSISKSLAYDFGMVRDEILSLHEAFNKFTAEPPSHHEELPIQSTHFSDVEYLIRYVITSFFYRQGAGNTPHWSHKVGFYNIIQEIRMINMGLKDIQNKMTCDTSANGEEKKSTALNVEKSKKLQILSIEDMSKIEDQPKWPETLGLKSTEVASKSSRSITDMNSEATMKNLNFLLEKIEDLLRCNVELIAPIQEELKIAQKSLRFLRNFLGFITKRCSKFDNLKDLLIHAQFLAENISRLLYPCSSSDEMNYQMAHKMKKQLSFELQKFSPAMSYVGKIYINSLKALQLAERNSSLVDEFELGFLDSIRDCILELSDTKLSFITSNKERILSLIEELRFVVIFFAMDKSLDEHFDQMSNNILECIIILIIDVGCVIYSFHNLDQDRDKSNHMKIEVSDLQNRVKIAKEDARKAYGRYLPMSLWSTFPRTNGKGFIGFLLSNVKELQSTALKLTGSLFQNADQILVAPLKHHIDVALKELLSLREEFTEIAKHPSQFEELQGLWTRFVGVAYQTEYVIDSFLSRGTCPLYHHKLELFDVIGEIKTMKMELEAIKNKMKDKTLVQGSSCFPTRISLEANLPKNNAVPRFKERMAEEQTVSKLVIFEKEAEKIREKLINGSKNLNFLSIVGMPGIGKTTLADSVFQHESITLHFYVRARCSVSQVHDKKRMLREILQEVTGERKQYKDDDLEQKLKQSLLGQRYLIFLDDMWDVRPWEDIRACFPNGNNGSWIMFTSRSEGIASQVALGSITYRLLPLSEEKSWEMLRVKVFGSQSCPPELVSVGREIAANCKGLPLTIDLIAGILRATKWENWKEVTENMMRRLLTDDTQDQCRNVLELSYRELPDELKPCFLYFAAFPEDAEVPARKLFSLWIAEGFVQLQKNDLRCLEKVAEDILNDLIARSLVTVSKSRALGGVKGTRIHDLLHEFALIKAEEESFVMIIDRKAEKAQWQKQYRLRISDLKVNFHGSCRARTVICIEPVYRMNLSVFRLLRVLDIPGGSPKILTLIHLRFLAIGWFADNAFSEIYKLQNLETFILKNIWETNNGKDEYLLLDKVCNMVRLRHIEVGNHFSFRYKKENILETLSLFDNLQTLCGLQLSYAEEIEKILMLMPNLVKLKVKFYNSDGECYSFPKLDLLKNLESLNVTHDDFQNPCKITSFPPSLKKLVLSKFQVPWTEISKMGNFEYLEVLKLKERAFVGQKWDMVDGQFPRLRCVSLHDLNIEEWNPSEGQLSCLEQLQVERCRRLKELPSCLAESLTLQVIKLKYCRESAVDSAERIKEEQREIGNEISVVSGWKFQWLE